MLWFIHPPLDRCHRLTHLIHIIHSNKFWGVATLKWDFFSYKPYLVRSIHTLLYALSTRWPISEKHIHFAYGTRPLTQGIKVVWISSNFSFFPYNIVYDSLYIFNYLKRCWWTSVWFPLCYQVKLKQRDAMLNYNLVDPLNHRFTYNKLMFICSIINIIREHHNYYNQS